MSGAIEQPVKLKSAGELKSIDPEETPKNTIIEKMVIRFNDYVNAWLPSENRRSRDVYYKIFDVLKNFFDGPYSTMLNMTRSLNKDRGSKLILQTNLRRPSRFEDINPVTIVQSVDLMIQVFFVLLISIKMVSRATKSPF